MTTPRSHSNNDSYKDLASIDEDKQKEVIRKNRRTAYKKNIAREFDTDEAHQMRSRGKHNSSSGK